MNTRKPSKREACKRCKGEGDVQGYEYGGFPAMFTCKACDGKGWVPAHDHTPTSEMDVADAVLRDKADRLKKMERGE